MTSSFKVTAETTGATDVLDTAPSRSRNMTSLAPPRHRAARGSRAAAFLTLLVIVMGVCAITPIPTLAQSAAWVPVASTGPSARSEHAMAFDSARGVTVLFGGTTGAFVSSTQTWEWNGIAWSQRVGPGPSARSLHAMAFDATRGVTVLFGGANASTTLTNDQTWEWNGAAWSQRVVPGPGARSHHAMAFDSARGVTVLFGGQNGGAAFDDTWEWNGTTWTQRLVAGPSPRRGHHLAYDSARGVCVLYGGTSGNGLVSYNETWEWNGTVWVQRAAALPAFRSNLAMSFDAGRGLAVINGGQAPTHDGQTWNWNGTTWTRQVIAGPPARSNHAMAFDFARGVSVLFGGQVSTGGLLGDTWELCIAPTITTQPVSAGACTSSSLGFTVAASGSGPRAYAWRRGGVPLDTIANPSAATAALSLTNIQPSDAGSYDCIVTNACGSATSDAATLTVNSPPSIAQQPSSASACTSGSAAFTIAANGTAPLTYQWQIQTATGTWAALDVNPLSLPCGGSAIATAPATGQTSIAISPCPGITAYQVRCIVSNGCGGITSNEATYSVCYANCDCSAVAPVLTANDFLCFLNAFASKDTYANCDRSSVAPVLNANDFQCFLNNFASGCP